MTKSSDCIEVLPESNVEELEGSYQTKHKKIDKEVDSKVNDYLKTTGRCQKRNTKYRRQFCREKKMNN